MEVSWVITVHICSIFFNGPLHNTSNKNHKRSPRDLKTETCSKLAATPKGSIALKLFHALVWVFLDFSRLVAILSQVVNKKHTVGLSWLRNVLVMVAKPLTWTIFLKPNQQKEIDKDQNFMCIDPFTFTLHINFSMYQNCIKSTFSFFRWFHPSTKPSSLLSKLPDQVC